MALLDVRFFSEVLQIQTAITVLLPQRPFLAPPLLPWPPDGKLACLWLLHGLSDDHTIWTRRTALERHVDGRNLAVVMPPAGRSYYADMAAGERWWTFVSEEVPHVARSMFPIAADRPRNFVAGLSMGGYGAFKHAFLHPGRYAAAASLSGALDAPSIARARIEGPDGPQRRREFENMFGDLARLQGGPHDLFHLAETALRSRETLPRLYQCCGTEDFLYEDNRRFRDFARRIGLAVDYDEGPGAHEWGYWDAQIRKVLDWIGV